MRTILAVIFVCALGMPTVSALPAISSGAISAAGADPIVQFAKRKQQRAQPQRRQRSSAARNRASGGIHPLVGSGDY